MGFWGSYLYSNDLTCDVRDTYIDLLKEKQLSDDEALKEVYKVYKDLDEDEEALFWYALAETQWKLGRLTEEVKEKALGFISQCGGHELFLEDFSNVKSWQKTLDKLKLKLNQEMPPRKSMKKRNRKPVGLWNLYDIYAFHFISDELRDTELYDKYILLQMIDQEPCYVSIIRMRIQIIDGLYDHVPTLDEIEYKRALPPNTPLYDDIRMDLSVGVVCKYKKEVPWNLLFYVGNRVLKSERCEEEGYLMQWRNAERRFSKLYLFWKDKTFHRGESGDFYIDECFASKRDEK